VSLISRKGTVNLSNMDVVHEESHDILGAHAQSESALDALSTWVSSLTLGESKEDWKITKFAPTPKMSTYLVAFANGPFEYREASYTSPLSGVTRPLRIYATEDNIDQTQYALDVTSRACLPLFRLLTTAHRYEFSAFLCTRRCSR
jgi:aminopeptidase 2